MPESFLNPVIALDADGVLLDYHSAYAKAWERAFGERPEVADPDAYWPKERYGLRLLRGSELARFKAQFDESFWESVPPAAGALEACSLLRKAGHSLVCVTAVEPRHLQARERNLLGLGFPLEAVVAAPGAAESRSPKAEALERIMPAAFVDDYLPYLRGIHPSIHGALIDRSPNGSPNRGPELASAKSLHPDLLSFARYWTSRG